MTKNFTMPENPELRQEVEKIMAEKSYFDGSGKIFISAIRYIRSKNIPLKLDIMKEKYYIEH